MGLQTDVLPKSRSRSGGPGAPDLSQAQFSCPRGDWLGSWGAKERRVPGQGGQQLPHLCIRQSRPFHSYTEPSLLSFQALHTPLLVVASTRVSWQQAMCRTTVLWCEETFGDRDSGFRLISTPQTFQQCREHVSAAFPLAFSSLFPSFSFLLVGGMCERTTHGFEKKKIPKFTIRAGGMTRWLRALATLSEFGS